MAQINKADSAAHCKQIADLATTIWTDHYTPIIGASQVVYMLDKFQSAEAINSQILKGSEYYIMTYEGKPSGYFCVKGEEDTLFLSKLYVLRTCRGKGLGKMAMQYIEQRAEALGYGKISLTVNKYNQNSIKAYKKMGFQHIKALIQDIGNGFIMDDYLLEKKIKGTKG